MTLQERLVSEAVAKYAQDTSPKAHNLLSAEDLETLILHTIEQTIKEERERVNKILAGHGKGCDPRYHAECIEMIHEDVNKPTDTQYALRGIYQSELDQPNSN